MNKTIKKITALGMATVVGAFLTLAKPNMALAQEKVQQKQVTIDDKVKEGPKFLQLFVEGDYDTRGFTTVNGTYALTGLPLGLNSFGFLDMESAHGAPKDAYYLKQLYGEARLTKPIGGGFELAAEVNKGTGKDAVYRLGFIRPTKTPWGKVTPKVFIYNSNGVVYQLSLASLQKFFGGAVKLEGFIDYNVVKGGPDKIVAEPNILIKLPGIDNTYFMIQLRLHEYLKGLPGGDKGIGFGLRYEGK